MTDYQHRRHSSTQQHHHHQSQWHSNNNSAPDSNSQNPRTIETWKLDNSNSRNNTHETGDANHHSNPSRRNGSTSNNFYTYDDTNPNDQQSIHNSFDTKSLVSPPASTLQKNIDKSSASTTSTLGPSLNDPAATTNAISPNSTANNVTNSDVIQSQLAYLLESEMSFFLSKKASLQTLDSMLMLSKYYYTQYQQQQQHRSKNKSISTNNGLILKFILDCLQSWTDAVYVCVTTIAMEDEPFENSKLATESGYKKRLNQRINSKKTFGSLYDMIENHVAYILTRDEHHQTVGDYGSSSSTPVSLTAEYLLNLYLKSLVVIGNLNCIFGNSSKAMNIFHKALKFRPNYHEALFGMGLACWFKHQHSNVEVWWRQAIHSQPCYWEAVDQLFNFYTSQNKQKENIDLLTSALEMVDQKQVRQSPTTWCKYLSELHLLGETYSLLEMYYESLLVYSWLVGMVLLDKTPSLEDLGLSQRVDQQLGSVDPPLVSLVKSAQPDYSGERFLPKLISDISTAIVKAEKPVRENVSAASCDNTHLAFGKENILEAETDSSLCVVPPRQALVCKYFLLPPVGKIPAKANTPDWEKYLNEVIKDNGICVVEPENSDSTFGNDSTNANDVISNKGKGSSKTLTVKQHTIDLIISNALLNLSKVLQDGICSGIPTRIFYINGRVPSQYEILGLYSLSLSLNPNPSIANNIGILLASEQNNTSTTDDKKYNEPSEPNGTQSDTKKLYELPMLYYDFGLRLDKRNTHIYTNLGSLFRARGEPQHAIQMYKMAVNCDPKFNIALTNLASALRESGEIDMSIHYYRRAVECAPDFIEAVSGLANSRLSVCDWSGRGGWGWEEMSVDENGVLVWGQIDGWLPNVVQIVDDQIKHAKDWGLGVIGRELASFNANHPSVISDVAVAMSGPDSPKVHRDYWYKIWTVWQNKSDEGARVVQCIEFATRVCQHRWYMDKLKGTLQSTEAYPRPKIPSGLPVPLATSVLPFHAFTLPFNAHQVFEIAQRTSIRLAVSSLNASWLPPHVFSPPPPPVPIEGISKEEGQLEENNVGKLVVGYISSDLIDHPLAHLMQSVFGFHDKKRVHAICYATTVSDGSDYRLKVEKECHEFKDVSDWSSQRVIEEIQNDGVHILVNLNGFTRGARNDIFAVRPCPVQVSLIGFAGSLGGGWCDYLLADKQAIQYPDEIKKDEWVYKEKIIYMPRSFFVCDHRQSALDSEAMRKKNSSSTKKPFRFLEAPVAKTTAPVDNTATVASNVKNNSCKAGEKVEKPGNDGDQSLSSKKELLLDKVLRTPGKLSWELEQRIRRELREVIFPRLPKDAFLMGNLNQLYKIDPTTFKVWLSILSQVPNSYLWLLQFPKSGEAHLKSAALKWSKGDQSLVDRLLFTQIADKNRHILRARVCDVFVDTPECNAHTTAADVAWSGTPILTYPRYSYKMCSRIASSIITAALPDTEQGRKMVSELVVKSDEEYETRGCYFAGTAEGRARLLDIRKTIFDQRETGDFFDTRQWVRYVEKGYRQAWRNWVNGKHEHIYLTKD